MFKAQIITNINGKQTVVEFDNQHEYQDYLKNHPDIQDQMNWTPTFPSWFANRTGLPRWSDGRSDLEKLVDRSFDKHLGYQDQNHSNPFALVKNDMSRINREEEKAKEEEERKKKDAERKKKELEEAKELLKNYKAKAGHNPDYAKKLEDQIKELEKEK